MHKKTILVVDDDTAIRETIRDVLEDENYKVFEAENGMKALNICKNENIDLTLLDISIPNIDGEEVLKKIKQMDKKIKVVMISAHITKDKKEYFFKKGADDFLEKPISIETLLNAIKKYLS